VQLVFLRVLVVKEGQGALQGRDAAGEVESGAAEKLGIVGRGRGGDSRAGEAPVDFAINGGGDNEGVAAGGVFGPGCFGRRLARPGSPARSAAGIETWLTALHWFGQAAERLYPSADYLYSPLLCTCTATTVFLSKTDSCKVTATPAMRSATLPPSDLTF